MIQEMIYNLEPDFQHKDMLYATWNNWAFKKRVDSTDDVWHKISRIEFERAVEDSVKEAIIKIKL